MVMKKYFFLLSLIGVFKPGGADDLTASITNATVGLNNGAVDLSVNAGVTPYTFAWTGPGGFTSFDEDITDLAVGEYCVTVTDSYCGVAVLCVTVEEDIASGTEDMISFSLTVFPNPFSGEFNIVCNSPSSGEYVFTLYDLTGKSVWTEKRTLVMGPNTRYFILQNDIAEGRYEIVISDDHGTILSRSIVRIR